MSVESTIDQEVQRSYRHNFLVNVLDGTFFWCGSSLIAASTILPVYVSRLSDSELLILSGRKMQPHSLLMALGIASDKERCVLCWPIP